VFIPSSSAEAEVVGEKTHSWYCGPERVEPTNLHFVRATFPPGEFHDFHNHPGMEEVLYILSGQAEQWIEDEKKILSPGDAVYIAKGVVHATFNPFTKPLEFLAVLSPADSSEPMTLDRSQEEPWKSMRS